MEKPYYQQRDDAAAKRISYLIALPIAPTREESGSEGYFDPWDAFDGILGAYNSEIDEIAIRTLEAIRDRTNFELLDEKHGLFAEFFMHILAGHNYVDYGTSPRGAFPTYQGTDRLLDAWIAKWKDWYAINWADE